jgi:hypothetical protein
MVPEPQSGDSVPGEEFCSRSIVHFPANIVMIASIKLNREMSLRTIEI